MYAPFEGRSAWHNPRIAPKDPVRINTSTTARTPERTDITEDGRQTIALLSRSDQTVNVVLVALTDGVELEVRADGALRQRCRFLRDTEARKYADRLAGRLSARGYTRDSAAR